MYCQNQGKKKEGGEVGTRVAIGIKTSSLIGGWLNYPCHFSLKLKAQMSSLTQCILFNKEKDVMTLPISEFLLQVYIKITFNPCTT